MICQSAEAPGESVEALVESAAAPAEQVEAPGESAEALVEYAEALDEYAEAPDGSAVALAELVVEAPAEDFDVPAELAVAECPWCCLLVLGRGEM